MKPLYDAIKNYIENINVRYHMPGHSGSVISNNIYSKFDVTEVPGLDNLLQSNEVILEAENLLAKDYNFNYSLMVTCGSTILMQMSIFYARDLDYKIVSIGQMHSSFYNTLNLHKINKISFDDKKEFKQYFKKNKDKYAIFITNPDYFGNVQDIKELINFAHENNSIVIVDAAHAAHFVFSSLLKEFFPYDADIVFTSMHKTTPSLGGGAAIFCNDEKVYKSLYTIRQMCHTTSPSYLIMASMDVAREELEKTGEATYKKIREKIDSYHGKFGQFDIVKNNDFSRLVLRKENCDAYDILLQLQSKGFGIEMAIFDKLVLIVTPYNVEELDALLKALSNIIEKTKTFNLRYEHRVSTGNLKTNEIYYVSFEESLDKIVASDISIYPPGVPIIHRGEIINKDVLNILKDNSEHLLGIVNGKIPVLK